MPGGRPTDYSKEVAEQAKEYLKNYKEYGDAVPSVVGLCAVINRSKGTVYNWAKDEDKPEFLDTLSAIQEVQEQGLVNGGLKNEMNPTITKLMLANHGMHDKVDNTNKMSGALGVIDLSDKTEEELDKIIKDGA